MSDEPRAETLAVMEAAHLPVDYRARLNRAAALVADRLVAEERAKFYEIKCLDAHGNTFTAYQRKRDHLDEMDD